MENEITALKRTDSLVFKFAFIFGIISLFSILVCGTVTYLNQIGIIKKNSLRNARNIGDYLEKIIQNSGNEFIIYQNYYMEHYAEIDIPYDFSEYHTALNDFKKLLVQNSTLSSEKNGIFRYEELSDEEKKAYFIYQHEYWLLTFEKARESFNLPYTYYLVPREDEYVMVYMIDGERTHKDAEGNKADEGTYLYLGDEYFNAPEEYPVEWNTWFSGEKLDDFQIWNNEWGHTYAYYTPLIINGQKIGLIGTEVEVADVDRSILITTLQQAGLIIILLILFIIFIMLFINDSFVKKIISLESEMREFSLTKNPHIAERIKSEIHGKNEITALSYQFADLILELEKYMKNLFETSKELDETKHQANLMNELAHTDSLTGIRNKTSYDNEIERLDRKIARGYRDFGIVMIDLNYLKVINDNYGHEKGDIALKKLSEMINAVFENSSVYRIGGDEFVVIVEHHDYKNVMPLVDLLNTSIDTVSISSDLEPWEKISAAVGFALYDERIDRNFSSVFTRADKAMYERKKEMKAIRSI